MGIPVASLARVSTTGQAGEDRGGLPRQRQAIAEAVQRHGLHVVAAFELPGVGGDKVSSTPAWSEIRGMLASGAIRGVVCDAVDRLCRASDLDLTVLADLQRHGASIWTPGEVRDLSSATDGLLAGLLALLGGVEKTAITRRAYAGKKARRKSGAWTESPDKLPRGVEWDRASGWSYTPEVEPIVRLAERYASGEASLQSLARSMGLPYGVAKSAMAHPLYRGQLRTLDGELIEVLSPPAIDAGLAARVDARRAKRARQYAGGSRRKAAAKLAEGDADPDPFLLRGVLFCARCGLRLDTVTRKRRGGLYWRGYWCSGANRRWDPTCQAEACDAKSLPLDAVHWAVTGMLEILAVEHPLAWNQAADISEEREETQAAEVDRLDAVIADLTRQRAALVKLHLRQAITEAEFDKERAELAKRIEAVEVERKAVAAEAVTLAVLLDTLKALKQRVREMRRAGDVEALPRLLREVGGRVLVERVAPTDQVGGADIPAGEEWSESAAVWTTEDGRVGILIRMADIDAGRVLTAASRGPPGVPKSDASARHSAWEFQTARRTSEIEPGPSAQHDSGFAQRSATRRYMPQQRNRDQNRDPTGRKTGSPDRMSDGAGERLTGSSYRASMARAKLKSRCTGSLQTPPSRPAGGHTRGYRPPMQVMK